MAHPDWLAAFVRAAAASGRRLLGGRIEYVLARDNLANRFMMERHRPEVLQANVEEYASIPTGNLFVARDLVERYGAFDPAPTASDDEFSQRLAERGHPPLFVADAVVRHPCDLGGREYLRRSFHIRFGQEYLRRNRRPAHLWAALGAVPWRPGLNRARDLARRFSVERRYPVAAVLAYAWLDRLCTYAGGAAGALAALRKSSHS